MRRALATIGAFVLIGFMSATASAQDLSTVCEDITQQDAGGWAKYEMTGEKVNGTMRMALLSEGAGGVEGQWFEMAGTVNGQDAIIQLQADNWPFEPEEIRGVVMKAAGQPAMRLPESMLSQMRGQMNSPIGDMAESCAQGEMLGSETVEVPAGSFDTQKIRPVDMGEGTPDAVWLTNDVPFGVVKSEGPDGTMVLLEYGTDAMSSISEAPRSMPGMP